jgi:hypothetical protein
MCCEYDRPVGDEDLRYQGDQKLLRSYNKEWAGHRDRAFGTESAPELIALLLYVEFDHGVDRTGCCE